MSTFLCEILADVPIVDKMKVVILPDVQTADLEAFFRLLFAKETVLVKSKRLIFPRVKEIFYFSFGFFPESSQRKGIEEDSEFSQFVQNKRKLYSYQKAWKAQGIFKQT